MTNDNLNIINDTELKTLKEKCQKRKNRATNAAHQVNSAAIFNSVEDTLRMYFKIHI